MEGGRVSKTEEWKPIKGFEGMYAIGSLGNVKSLERFVPNKHGMRRVKERILKPLHFEKKPYPSVFLHGANGKAHIFAIHRLVAEYFVPNPDGKPEVNHIDGDKLNPSADNLEWVTARENSRHAWDNGLCANVANAKSRPDYVAPKRKNRAGVSVAVIQCDKETRQEIAVFDSIKQAVAITGACKTGISACCNGRRKMAGGFYWRYAG